MDNVCMLHRNETCQSKVVSSSIRVVKILLSKMQIYIIFYHSDTVQKFLFKYEKTEYFQQERS